MLGQKCTTDHQLLMKVLLKDLGSPIHMFPILEFADKEAPRCVAQSLQRFTAWQCLITLISIALIACDIACYWMLQYSSLSLKELCYQVLCFM